VQETSHGNTDGGEDLGRLVVGGQRLVADVIGAQRQAPVHQSSQRIADARLIAQSVDLGHEIAAIDEPDFAQHDEGIGRKYDAECRNGRREMRRQQRFHGA
jgi:hypothetical protein